jgi:hypothetical protein
MSGGFIPNFLGAGSGSSGGSQIGDQMPFMDIGTFYDKPNGERWLRSGQWVSPSLYPDAVNNNIGYLQATGQATAALPSNLISSAFDIATDGAGRWVIAFGSATNVMVSTDSGATWTNVAHNAGGVVTSVCWNATNSLFVCAGNTTVLFLTSTATAAGVASAWTARTGSVVVGSTVDTARVRASSAEVVMVCGGGTTGNASRSTNGTSWTATNIVTALSTTNAANGLTSLGGGIWIVTNQTSTGQRSTDGGTTWANVNYPTSFTDSAFGNGTLICSVSGNFYSSTTGATGSFTALGKPLGAYAPFGSNYGSSINFNGSLFVASVVNSIATTGALGFYATSPDGQAWTVKTAIGRSWADGTASAQAVMLVDANGNYVMTPSTQNLTTPTIVYGNLNMVTGIGFNAIKPTSTGYPAPTQYARIK